LCACECTPPFSVSFVSQCFAPFAFPFPFNENRAGCFFPFVTFIISCSFSMMKSCQRVLAPVAASSLIRRIRPFHVHYGDVEDVIEVFSGDPTHPVRKLNLLGGACVSALKGIAALLPGELNSEGRVAIFAPREGCSFSAGIDLKGPAGGPVTSETAAADMQFTAMRLQ
jgi:hypothetical protein